MCSSKGAEVSTHTFSIPTDSEGKSTVFRPYYFSKPHFLSFHLNWFSFFTSFVSVFAPAALIPVIRDDLDLTDIDLGNAAVAAMLGVVFSRIAMGSVCDVLGPRYGHAFIMLLSASAVFGMGLTNDAAGFIIGRVFIGFSLATFVCCQFWCSVMFNVKIVGTANAFAAGWGNLGGGVTQLLMPLVYEGILHHQTQFVAWRYAFIVPGLMHVVVGMAVLLFGQDLPEGQYHQLKKSGALRQDKSYRAVVMGLLNYRSWVMAILYGYCFGLELTVDNIIVTYFVDNFNQDLLLAGVYGAIFGLMNIFARALGGVMSDVFAKRWGMRGRLWAYFLQQATGGALCAVMGYVNHSLGSTIAVMVLFSVAIQSGCGGAYGIVPFISKRSLGVVSGLVGAGGNAGSALQLALFFQGTVVDCLTYEGLRYVGFMTLGLTVALMPLIYFPMWGGMFLGPRKGATEEDYYGSEYTPEERAQGLADRALKFARESRSQRGHKAQISVDATPERTT